MDRALSFTKYERSWVRTPSQAWGVNMACVATQIFLFLFPVQYGITQSVARDVVLSALSPQPTKKHTVELGLPISTFLASTGLITAKRDLC